ncbi:MAG: hypothetical protein JJE36_06510 [Coriobacteriia bacterium]|nr:hypothetical protein [Coriobacteriia bacterium]
MMTTYAMPRRNGAMSHHLNNINSAPMSDMRNHLPSNILCPNSRTLILLPAIVGVPQGSRFTVVCVKRDDWKEYLKEEKYTKPLPFQAYNDIKDAVEVADEADWVAVALDESIEVYIFYII